MCVCAALAMAVKVASSTIELLLWQRKIPSFITRSCKNIFKANAKTNGRNKQEAWRLKENENEHGEHEVHTEKLAGI